MKDHVKETIRTYDLIASDYGLTATPELRAWQSESIRKFISLLEGTRVLVPGCGDGRDSGVLLDAGLEVRSFDLSDAMLSIARKSLPPSSVFKCDLRNIANIDGIFDGVFASGCLYHLERYEFSEFLTNLAQVLAPGAIVYMSMKIGTGGRFISTPSKDYPGGEAAQKRLKGNRYYQFYTHEELLQMFSGEFEIVEWRRKAAHREHMNEYWLRHSST